MARPKISMLMGFIFAFMLTSILEHTALANPLVETELVSSAGIGARHTLHCQVSSPFVHQLASEANAKLLWALPLGSKVEKGQLVAEQDGYYLNLQLAEVDIAIAQAKSDLRYYQGEYQRLVALQDGDLVSQSRISELEWRTDVAQTTISRLENNQTELKYRKANLKHFAPNTGEIIATQTQPGEHINSGETILHIQAKKDKELQCKLPHSLYIASHQLRETAFKMEDSSPLKLMRYSTQLQYEDQTTTLYLRPEKNTADRLFFSQRVKAQLYFQQQKFSRIPHATLLQATDHTFVWRLDDKNRVSKVEVQIMSTEAHHFLVSSALLENDKLVTLGKEKLNDGQQVVIAQPSNLIAGSTVEKED